MTIPPLVPREGFKPPNRDIRSVECYSVTPPGHNAPARGPRAVLFTPTAMQHQFDKGGLMTSRDTRFIARAPG